MPYFVSVPNEFLISDIKIEDNDGHVKARHLILASANQVAYLGRAGTWYVDGTFKSVDDILFIQAFGIHAFLQCEDRIKQVPLVTVMMSRRTKKDYEAVFVELSQHLGSDIKLEDCIMDFEAATWTSLRAVFPGVCIQ